MSDDSATKLSTRDARVGRRSTRIVEIVRELDVALRPSRGEEVTTQQIFAHASA